MKEARLGIERWPYEPEWRLYLTATDGAIATAIEFYIVPQQLEPFAAALTTFPRQQPDDATFEVGGPEARWAYHVRLRAHTLDALGHSALEILTDDHSSSPHHTVVHFSIRCEPAALNRLGREITRWLKMPDDPVDWHANVI